MPGGHTLQSPVFNPKVPILNTAPVVRWLVASCALVELLMIVLPEAPLYELIDRFAFLSARYTFAGAWGLDPLAYVAAPITYMFLHGGLTHLLVNMAMLLAFGTAIARRMGVLSFLLLYGICGIAGAAFWLFMHPASTDPLLGASGAISGMVGAVGRISLNRSDSHDMPFRNRGTAFAFVLMWLVLNFVFGIIGGAVFGIDAEIAWEAHLGGFIAGFALIGLFAHPPRTEWRA